MSTNMVMVRFDTTLTHRHLGRSLKMSKLIEVGDSVVVDNGLTRHIYKITRVTKTLALSKRDDDGYEHRFNRDPSKGIAYPRERYSMTSYTIIRGDA